MMLNKEASRFPALREELVKWMAEYLEHSGKEGFVLGMSGGVDSSVLALLARDAAKCMEKSFIALIMPINNDYYDEFSAKQICEQFGIDYRVIDLKGVYDLWLDVLPDASDRPVVYTNLKARSREAALYYFANHSDLLVLGTVNKGELSIGYFPKNASAGDLLPLASLLKREVRELGRMYGVNEHIVTAKASGCIWAKTAEQEWEFSEDDLDQMASALSEAGQEGVLRIEGIHADIKEKFLKMHRESAHKRVFYPLFLCDQHVK